MRLQGENIICFAKDWDEAPTSNNHLMLELAKDNRVLWLNSIATRTPRLSSSRDLRKIINKLASFIRGTRKVRENLWVYTPLVLPMPHNKLAAKLNQHILRLTLKFLRRRLDMREFQLWTFLPNMANYVGKLGESLVVYYCVDEWSKFTALDSARTAEAERQLLAAADVVFASAQSLVNDRLPFNAETHLSRHGVDHRLFAAALDGNTVVPADIAALPKPVVGFYGTLQDWVDFDLIVFLASRHPEWSIVLIGPPLIDVSKLRGFPNVHLLGRRTHDALPKYCKGFSVGIIPYRMNERILHVNPLKLREYLSAGLPVVSVPLPELEGYRLHCAIASTFDEFEQAVAEALRTDSRVLREQRSRAMQSETWALRVEEISAHVARAQARRVAKKEWEQA